MKKKEKRKGSAQKPVLKESALEGERAEDQKLMDPGEEGGLMELGEEEDHMERLEEQVLKEQVEEEEALVKEEASTHRVKGKPEKWKRIKTTIWKTNQ